MHLVLHLFAGQVWHRADLEPDPSQLCMQHRLSNDPLATYKTDFLGLDPAQLPTADLGTAPRQSLKIEELQDHLF